MSGDGNRQVQIPRPSRYYHTDSRIAGVRVQLPQSVRVVHQTHEEFGGDATLVYDAERRDHVLTKVESVPGIREENEHGFSWVDPVTGESKGGLVAFPPVEWGNWDGRRRVWCRETRSRRLSGIADVWPAMGPPLPEGRVACRALAWEWVDPGAAPLEPGAGVNKCYKGVRRGEITGHEFSGSSAYGGAGTWTVAVEAEQDGAGSETTTFEINTVQLRAALDLRHVLDCRDSPPAVPGWATIRSRSTGEYYYAREGVGSQWHRPGLVPSNPGDRERCKASCAVWGHRSKANIVEHRNRMDRIRRNFEFKDEKLELWRNDGERRGLSYYDWCVEQIQESPTFEEFRRLIGENQWDEERCILGLLALRRDYDHIASDSDLSESEEEEEEEEEWQEYDPSALEGGLGRGRQSSRRRMDLQTEALSAYVDSPGFASRLLHHDGSNRTRSGTRFGGTNHRSGREEELPDFTDRRPDSNPGAQTGAQTGGPAQASSPIPVREPAAAAAAAAGHEVEASDGASADAADPQGRRNSRRRTRGQR